MSRATSFQNTVVEKSFNMEAMKTQQQQKNEKHTVRKKQNKKTMQ